MSCSVERRMDQPNTTRGAALLLGLCGLASERLVHRLLMAQCASPELDLVVNHGRGLMPKYGQSVRGAFEVSNGACGLIRK